MENLEATSKFELAQRKNEHIDHALHQFNQKLINDKRFNYEPLFSSHIPKLKKNNILNKTIDHPFWISSMTGGGDKSLHINQNLAHLCREFKIGMGLGSCRAMLEKEELVEHFNLRKIMGYDLPLFANLGIAQIEKYLLSDKIFVINDMMKKIEADALIIHINPLQEYFQANGDKLTLSPFETINRFIEQFKSPVVIKEVGQGMGEKSLHALMKLNILGIETASFGGTNFSAIELQKNNLMTPTETALINVGHDLYEMTATLNLIGAEKLCILSGGIKNMLDAHYALSKYQGNAIVGVAGMVLEHALGEYKDLESFFAKELSSYYLAKNFLVAK
jgi:isopentenyl-diphosphate delta-isomerase